MTGDEGLDARLVVRRGGFTLDVGLTVAPGRTAALLGPNGAGKSTIVAALAGIVPLDEGYVRVDGKVLDEPATDRFMPPEGRATGIAFQDGLLFEHLTVAENVAFGPVSRGVPRRAARREAGRWLDLFGLEQLADRRPAALSGGQAQRVAIARAMAAAPRLLLLDEPFAALDVESRRDLRRLLVGLLAEHAGPRLIITHDPTDAFLLGDELHVVEDGRLVQRGRSEEIRRRPATPYVAALAGTNLLTGTNTSGTITLDHHDHVLHTDDTHTTGAVLVTVHPRAVALHPDQPHGSPRNTWRTTVVDVEPLGDTTRILLDRPIPLTADITPAAAAALGLRPGTEIWAAVKATEVAVSPA